MNLFKRLFTKKKQPVTPEVVKISFPKVGTYKPIDRMPTIVPEDSSFDPIPAAILASAIFDSSPSSDDYSSGYNNDYGSDDSSSSSSDFGGFDGGDFGGGGSSSDF